MINQDNGPATGRITTAARFLWRTLAATCLSVAAARGAHASTIIEPGLLALDAAAKSYIGGVLPDASAIVEVPLSTTTAMVLTRLSNFALSPVWRNASSPANAAAVPEGPDGWGLVFASLPDQESFPTISLTVSTGVPDASILRAGLKLEGRPVSYKVAHDPPSDETSDSAWLILTGLGFVLAGSVGRPNRHLRRGHKLDLPLAGSLMKNWVS